MPSESQRNMERFLFFIYKSAFCVLLFQLIDVHSVTIMKVDDPCNNGTGICRAEEDCPIMANIPFAEVPFCRRTRGIVCCPYPQNITDNGLPEESMSYSDKACRNFSRNASTYCPTGYITHGSRAKVKEFPPAALLGIYDGELRKFDWYCGGTLISERFVITAAHCFVDAPSELNVVRLGELDYSTENDGAHTQDFNISRIIIYPAYDINAYYDIVLLELDRAAKFDDFVFPACLLTPNMTKYRGDELTAIGWGKTERGFYSKHLMKVNLKMLPMEVCAAEAPRHINLLQGLKNRTQFCAGSETGGFDTCSGDSGGPLLTVHPHYKCMFLLVGITSMGKQPCGGNNSLSLNVNVTIYSTWIEQTVWKTPDLGDILTVSN